MEKRNIVGERVRQARKRAKPPVTQLDLVARLQVLGMKIDQSGLSKIEGGNRPVFDYEVIALAKALKVEVGWLLGESAVPATPVGSKRGSYSKSS
jgi:transcriptional regulator with XRE-family HTH domain